MNKCKQCGSYAINDHLHGREKGKDLDLCDVCYWRKKYFEVSTDILPLLNPWRDAEKEKPEKETEVLVKLSSVDGFFHAVGIYRADTKNWYFYDHELIKAVKSSLVYVLSWMRIPKNEGE